MEPDAKCHRCEQPAVIELIEDNCNWWELLCGEHAYRDRRKEYWKWRLRTAGDEPVEVEFDDRRGNTHRGVLKRVESCCGAPDAGVIVAGAGAYKVSAHLIRRPE
jgi:hypothetical protein